MKISALRLFNVKRFTDRGVAIEGISDGVNVLSAHNEFGKSTSFEALHALFFQAHASTAGDVRNLRPYAGGSPLIEADIETGDGRFRIAKQFYSGKAARVTDINAGRLIAQADEAENFIANLISGGTAGPAGLLWVRQGITGIEKRTKSEEDNERQLRAGLLESVQGEIEAVTGGRRMAEIMAVVEKELEQLVSGKRRSPQGKYAEAIAEHNRLQGQEYQFSREVAALRTALDERATARQTLKDLDNSDERAQRVKDIESAQNVFDMAKTYAEKLRAAEAEFNLCKDKSDRANTKLETYRKAKADAVSLAEGIKQAQQVRDQALTKRNELQAQVATAREVIEEAEKDEAEARTLLARLDAAIKAKEAAERLARLEQKLEQAYAVRAQIEEAEAQLTAIRLPEGALEKLDALEIEIAGRRAAALATLPSISVQYEVGANRISLNGIPLENDKPQSYREIAKLDIPGTGTLSLHAGQMASANDLLALEEDRRALLEQMKVADRAAAHQRTVDARDKQSDLRDLNTRLALFAPDGLPALRQAIAESLATAAGESEVEVNTDRTELLSNTAEADDKRALARAKLREVEALRAPAEAAFLSAEKDLARLEAALSQTQAILGPQEARLEHESHLVSKLKKLDTQLSELDAELSKLRANATELASAEAKLTRLRSVADAANKQINGLREKIAGLNATIIARSDDAIEEKWRESKEAFTAAEVRVASFEKEVAVLQRLQSALEAARSQARETYLRPVMNELRPLMELLFDDVNIAFDEKTLLPHKIVRGGQEEDVEHLSGGMREQLSVLTRLAFARLLAKEGKPAPVILDDALVYSDDDRIEKMFDALHRQADGQQIIVFSCRQRAFQKLGGNVLQMTPWVPDF